MNTIMKRSQSSEPIAKGGLRFYDKMIITPAFGRKKEIRLNRTKFEIKTSQEETKFLNSSISLKQIGNELYEFDLELINDYSTKSSEDAGRYLLRVKSEKAIWHNGNYVFEAFLKRGDEIHFQYNKITFQDDSEEHNEDLPFNKNIIESNVSLLLEGETGTGKSFLAKKIHENSNLLGPFIHVNLSSFSLSLIESELFGHSKGAFTGAVTDKIGALREANRGTLFLDEIDSLPIEVQTKLLLFLDSGQVRPVGAMKEYESQVRLICASGQNLKKLVEQGKMRKDFFFRISSGFQYNLAPLRKEKEKIAQVCMSFALDNNIQIESKLIHYYQNCEWPGNIRQLIGHLRKKTISTKGRVLYFDEIDQSLGHDIAVSNEILGGVKTLKEVQTQYCLRIFHECGEKVSEGARILGITPATLRSYLRQIN